MEYKDAVTHSGDRILSYSIQETKRTYHGSEVTEGGTKTEDGTCASLCSRSVADESESIDTMNRYEYEVAGIRMLCEIPFDITIQEESEAFMRVLSDDEMPEVDLTMQFCMVNAFPEAGESYHSEACQYYVETAREWRVYHRASPSDYPYACTIWDREHPHTVLCQYLSGKEKYLDYSRNIINHLGLETLMRVWRGLLLHASLIRWKGSGILFTAPSGTGKSTQANLWKQYESADILNGDRAALRPVDGTWYAYGLPYAGSSGIYRNESVPVKAIAVLRQAKENRIRALRPQEAVRYLYSEVTTHRWDREFVEEIWEIMLAMLGQIPVYLLECRPDAGAVQLMKDTLTAGESRGASPNEVRCPG